MTGVAAHWGALSRETIAARVPDWRDAVLEASNPFASWYFGDADVARELTAEWMARPDSELYLGRAVALTVPGSDADRASQERACGLVLCLTGAELATARAADFAAFVKELGGGADADAVLEEVVPAARALFPTVAPEDGYLSRVALRPEFRGRGLGRALVEAALAHLRARGCARARLDVSDGNAAAVRVYEACGFSTLGVGADPGSGLTYRAMARAL